MGVPRRKGRTGETDGEALVRECEEELAVRIEVGARIGGDIPLGNGYAILRVWVASLLDGEPQALEHSDLRWLSVDELYSVPWLPADAPIVAELARIMGARE